MTRTHWSLGPGLVVGTGLVAATALAAMAIAGPGWMAGAGALVFALSLVAADCMNTRLRGEPSRPSWLAAAMAAVFLLACAIVGAADPASVAMMMPILGGGVAVPVLQGAARGRCAGAPSAEHAGRSS